MACYAAKDKGRNRVHIYRSDDAELRQRHGEMEWVARLNRAIEDDRFELFRQCIFPLQRGGSRHHEFLLRLRGDGDALIPPGAFIPAAERYNLMPDLDRWVVRHALAHLARLYDPAALGEVFFINLSGATLSDDQFATFATQQLRKHGLPPAAIGFEITETAVIANLASALDFIHQVKAFGCRVALDDFGSGLSSFSYLKTIPADYLKIDGSFILGMLDDPMDRAIVDAVNRIGHVAGLKTVAEFVESEALKQRLIELGVDYAQGYAIHRRAPLGAVTHEVCTDQGL
jgi:EAL domain-containing protein (putative c-di-GMP-specific phosphodiesterase class I)